MDLELRICAPPHKSSHPLAEAFVEILESRGFSYTRNGGEYSRKRFLIPEGDIDSVIATARLMGFDSNWDYVGHDLGMECCVVDVGHMGLDPWSLDATHYSIKKRRTE